MPFVTLEGDESMITAMKVIQKRGIKRAALVKNGQLIGMLTEEMAKKAAVQVESFSSLTPHLYLKK